MSSLSDEPRAWRLGRSLELLAGAIRAELRARRIARSIERMALALSRCNAPRAYRSMADIGSREVCGNPVVLDGLCRRHHPTTAPRRDKAGRIIARPQEA
jgi:hypothetical protein